MNTPLILVSNDDGYDSPGIYELVSALTDLGEIVVAAPATQQSAVGHAITVQRPLRARAIQRGPLFQGWSIDGTPADSVKLAVTTLLPRKPDLVLSGINHGMNTAINIVYSGTVSAASEGAILGIPSIAVSHASHSLQSDLQAAASFARAIAGEVLQKGLPVGTILNVNVPDVPQDKIAGVKITRQGKSWWDDGFETRKDPIGKEYYWLVGKYVWDMDPLADDIALRNNYISVTPLHYDRTSHALFDSLQSWNINGNKDHK